MMELPYKRLTKYKYNGNIELGPDSINTPISVLETFSVQKMCYRFVWPWLPLGICL